MSFQEELQKLRNSHATVVVLGLGKSGAAAATFFRRLDCGVIIIEKRSKETYLQNSALSLVFRNVINAGAEVSFNDELPEGYEKAALCVISPGISPHSDVPSAIRAHKIPMIGELELGVEYSGIPSIVVTGSNGKSTVVTLIAEMMQYPGSDPYLCGNIGHPVVDLLESSRQPPSCLVVEASSYQLESCTRLHPKVAVLLNISENHLERHGDIEGYRSAKLKQFARQDENDFAVLNCDDPLVYQSRKLIKSQVCLFGQDFAKLVDSKNWAFIRYDTANAIDEIVVQTKQGKETYDLSKCLLVGEHSRYNIAAAILASRLSGAPVHAIERCIETFRGLSHRLEVISRENGKIIINDSKSTTVASTAAALGSVRKAFAGSRIKLLVGGKVKLGSWEPLAKSIKGMGASVDVTTFGGDGAFVAEALKRFGVASATFKTMKEAVVNATQGMQDGEVLLFSPGCASFDEFTDFEARGDMFRSYACPK